MLQKILEYKLMTLQPHKHSAFSFRKLEDRYFSFRSNQAEYAIRTSHAVDIVVMNIPIIYPLRRINYVIGKRFTLFKKKPRQHKLIRGWAGLVDASPYSKQSLLSILKTKRITFRKNSLVVSYSLMISGLQEHLPCDRLQRPSYHRPDG